MKASTYKQKLAERVSAESAQERFTPSKPVSEHSLLKTLNNTKAEMKERQAALIGLKALTFASPSYADWRTDFLNALREIVSNEGKTPLAFPALETLAQEKDEWALAKLEAILREPRGGVVSALDALRLLAYDDHGSHFDVLREIAPNRQKGQKIRLSAIRQLGADPSAAPILATIVQDQAEDPLIRRQALAALRHADRTRYDSLANTLLNDDSENEQVRAQYITALKVDGASPAVENTLRKVQTESSSEIVRAASESYFKQSSS